MKTVFCSVALFCAAVGLSCECRVFFMLHCGGCVCLFVLQWWYCVSVVGLSVLCCVVGHSSLSAVLECVIWSESGTVLCCGLCQTVRCCGCVTFR